MGPLDPSCNGLGPMQGLQQQQQQHRPGYLCPACGKTLSTAHGLRRHINDRHTLHLTPYQCYICQKEYRTPNSLQNHFYTYHKGVQTQVT